MTETILGATDIKKLAFPDHILVATDLTDSVSLLPHIITQAKASGAQVTLVHILRRTDTIPLDPGLVGNVDAGSLYEDARTMLHEMARQIKEAGIHGETAIYRGDPLPVIEEELRRTGATRIIIGTHGRGKVGQFLMGSVAHEVLAKVNVPVFVVGPHARESADKPRRILHPVSFTGDYEKSARMAVEIGKRFGAEVILLHVVEEAGQSSNPDRTMEWAQIALRALVGDDERAIQVQVASGDKVAEIERVATQARPDWIILGATDRSRSWSLKETTAYQVIANVNCPVLAVCHDPVEVAPKDFGEFHFTAPL